MGFSRMSDPAKALWRSTTAKNKKDKIKSRVEAGQGLVPGSLENVNTYATSVAPLTVQAGYRGYPSSSDTNYYADQTGGQGANATVASLANAYAQMMTGGGGKDGSTTPGAPDKNQNGTDFENWTGYAKDYTSGGMDIIYDEPRVLVRDLLKKMGFNADSGMIDLLANDAGTLQYLMMLTNGAMPDSSESMTDEDFINWTGDWAKMMTTPGAGAIDPNQMIQSILDAPGGSALAGLLANGTPQEQAAMLNNLMGVATDGYMPLAQRAMMGVLEGRTDDWLAAMTKGGKNTPLLSDWLQRGGNGVWG